MKRVALWLVSEVGEGNDFTKEELRQAFPGVSQVDRRMRDLRDFGWRIDTNREDASLDSSQHRFVEAGVPVWEPGRASRSGASAPISAARRYEVLAGDNNMCRSCGIAPGDEYADGSGQAQLDIARRTVVRPDGTAAVELVTECRSCRIGARGEQVDLSAVIRAVDGLSPIERRVLAGWVTADRREFSAIERLWARYRSLPEDSRAAVRAALTGPPEL